MSLSPANYERLSLSAPAVARLASSGIAEEAFYQRLLEVLPLPSNVVGTAAWRVDGNQFSRIAGTSIAVDGSSKLPFSKEQYGQHLRHVVVTRRPQCLAAPQSSSFYVGASGGSPSSVLTFPVVCDESVPILVEAYLTGDSLESPASERLKGFIEETMMLCAVAAMFHDVAPDRQLNVETAMIELPAVLHHSLHSRETCFAIANEGRRLLGWDRVSVLKRYGKSYRVEAISGQDMVNRRANVVKALQELTRCVSLTRERLWYPIVVDNLAPEIESVLEDYLALSAARRICVIPLCDLERVEHRDDSAPNETKLRSQALPFAAIVIEQFSDSVGPAAQTNRMIDFLTEQATLALRNATTHESVLMLPLMRWLGTQRQWFQASRRRLTLTILCGFVLVALAVCFLQTDLTIHGEGALLPHVRRHVFAPESGVVTDLRVKHESNVKAGELLLTLRNHELNLALEELRGELQKTQARLESLRAQRYLKDRAVLTESERLAIDAEERSLQAYLANLVTQEGIAKERQGLLRVTSPIAGKVMTWNMDERLQDRPVERGQILVEIADVSGPWELSLHVSDRYVADLVASAKNGGTIPVTFLIASDTTREYKGQVVDVSNATLLEKNSGQSVRVTVQIPPTEKVPAFQAGTSVQARIHCGRRSLGYVWFRDLWAFIYTRILFRWF